MKPWVLSIPTRRKRSRKDTKRTCTHDDRTIVESQKVTPMPTVAKQKKTLI
jgi:hypothetical protein